jgi:MFS family permease
LGSLLCGISSNIHVLVACRIMQGCGGAMMVPVGRLTLVRTFPSSCPRFFTPCIGRLPRQDAPGDLE